MSKAKIWTEVALAPEALARLQAAADVVTNGTQANLAGAEAAIIGGSWVDGTFLDCAGPSLKMVIRHGIGYDRVDVKAATQRGILSANAPDGPTESTAEHTVALLMAVTKHIAESDRVMRANLPVNRVALCGIELRDQLLGVIGYGRIGRRVTQICAQGLRMRVLVYDPYLPNFPELPEGVQRVNSLDELLPYVDAVTVHVPLAPESRHLIGERELRMMKAGAYLINASRGPVVDEKALIRALSDGHLAGAGLDVFDPEPPRPDNPLLGMHNVVVTPHLAGNTAQGIRRMSHSVVDQVLQLLAGERPAHVIDPEAWPGRAKASHNEHNLTGDQV